MSDPSSEHQDLMALWQGQSAESDPMTLEHIRAISRRLDRQTQWGVLTQFLTVAFGFFLAGLGWQRTEDPLTRAMYVLCCAGFVGSALVAYRLIHLRRDPTEPGGLFLRRRLEHRLRNRHGALMVLAPMAPGIVLTGVVSARNLERAGPHLRHLTSAQLALNWLPVVILAAIWCVVMLVVKPRVVRRTRRDLEELNAAMK